jgi:hypothetical protein
MMWLEGLIVALLSLLWKVELRALWQRGTNVGLGGRREWMRSEIDY